MKQRNIRIIKLTLAMLLVLTASQSIAGNARKLLRQGNNALKAEEYDAALDAYGKAALEAPESPSLIYNEGIVWYKKGDFVKARELFTKAGANARQSRVPDRIMEARCEQAVGNCWFREGQRQQDSNLQKSAEAFVSSIEAYNRALKIDQKNHVTLENRDAARLLLKKIIAEQAQREKALQEQQKQQEELARELAELAERQEQAADQSRGAVETAATTPTPQEKFAEMQGNQRAISTDTTTLAEKFQAMTPPPASPGQDQNSPTDSSPLGDILEEMTQAQETQRQAQHPLDRNAPAQAEPLQKQAAQHLRNALEKMKQQQEQQQQQQQQQEGQGQQQQQEKSDDGDENKSDDGKSEEEKQSAQADESDESEGEQQEQQVAREVDNDEAQDILNQEKTDKQRRQGNINRGYRPVPKDW